MRAKGFTTAIGLSVLLFGLCLWGCRKGDKSAAPTDERAAEAFYQQLLAQYKQDYDACLDPVTARAPDQPAPARPESSKKQLNVIVAFDSSGSMAERVSDGRKIDLAKEAVERFLGGLPQETQVGLVVYGHKGSNQPAGKALSCASVETIYPLTALDKARLAQVIQSFQPTGYTPLAAAINTSGQTLGAYAGETYQNVVYVISDGLETCGGDPVAAARALHASNLKAIINIIGFNVGNTDQQQLRAVAQAGGGQYLSAQNGADLNRALVDTTNLLKSAVYEGQNAIAQGRAEASYAIAIAKFNACLAISLTKEEGHIYAALNRLPLNDPKRQYENYIQERMRQRRAQIEAFQQQINDDLNNQREITLDKLKRDLDEVNKAFKPSAP